MATLLGELGEIRFENLFADGTKTEANANQYSFVGDKTTSKYEEISRAVIGLQ